MCHAQTRWAAPPDARDTIPRMSIPPPNGRRPMLAAVSILVIVAFFVFFIAVL